MGIVATLALQAALVAALRDCAPLTALLGGPKIFDDVPQGTEVPYVTAADIETRDWSSQTSAGHEHLVTLQVWSRWAGRKEALEILGEIDAALSGAALVLNDHKLIGLRIVSSAAERSRGGLIHAVLRLRAVTEPVE